MNNTSHSLWCKFVRTETRKHTTKCFAGRAKKLIPQWQWSCIWKNKKRKFWQQSSPSRKATESPPWCVFIWFGFFFQSLRQHFSTVCCRCEHQNQQHLRCRWPEATTLGLCGVKIFNQKRRNSQYDIVKDCENIQAGQESEKKSKVKVLRANPEVASPPSSLEEDFKG